MSRIEWLIILGAVVIVVGLTEAFYLGAYYGG